MLTIEVADPNRNCSTCGNRKGWSDPRTWECRKGYREEIDITSGRDTSYYELCDDMRDDGPCGTDAKLWEPRQPWGAKFQNSNTPIAIVFIISLAILAYHLGRKYLGS